MIRELPGGQQDTLVWRKMTDGSRWERELYGIINMTEKLKTLEGKDRQENKWQF